MIKKISIHLKHFSSGALLPNYIVTKLFLPSLLYLVDHVYDFGIEFALLVRTYEKKYVSAIKDQVFLQKMADLKFLLMKMT